MGDVGGRLGPCVLWLAGVDWDAVQGTDRQLVMAFDGPVVWVDSPVSPLRPGGRWIPAWRGGVTILRKDPLIVRVTPATVPFGTRPILRALPSPLKRLQVRRVLTDLGARPEMVVYTYLDPTRQRIVDEGVEILLGTDDYVAGSRLMGMSAAWLTRLERRAVKRAEVVFTVSPELAEKWGRLGARPRVLRNGCPEVPRSMVVGADSPPRSTDGPPVVGVVGQLSARIDLPILERLADAGVRLLLVGPRDPHWEPERFARLVHRTNVRYVGRVPAGDVPKYLAQIDVGLTPYKDTAFNRASFPLKSLEYLTAGIPVLSTDLPASRWIRDDLAKALGTHIVDQHFRICESGADFVSGAHELALTRTSVMDEERWRFSQRHSWKQRVKELEEWVSEISDLSTAQ